ncbi:MAG: aspartate carbamoyltransferase catalytic subunit [Opitutales bacterium]|nr:aspartate carbamoyltransferase catalytic subunit [Opitutales bacterium]
MIASKFLDGFNWSRKDLTNIKDLSLAEINEVMSLAEVFKKTIVSESGTLPYQQGKNIVTFFLEPSTRTRNAFEMSARRLGANVLAVNSSASSITKGETLKDTAKNLEAITSDMIIIRHSAAGAAEYLAERLAIPVVNAGDGAHAHPTQALLDSFTLRERFGQNLSGLHVTILGDILFSRVARSNIYCLQRQGVEVTLAGPSTLIPRDFEKMGVKIKYDLRDAVSDADAVMLLRIQHERQGETHFPSIGEYANVFGLNQTREGWLKKDAIIMHPGPVNRGVELDTYLADSPRSVILKQVTNGVAVRMAVLHLCLQAAEKSRR